MKRKEVKVKGYSGIYRQQMCDATSGKWRDINRYRAIKYIVKNGVSVRASEFFEHFDDAKKFRFGVSTDRPNNPEAITHQLADMKVEGNTRHTDMTFEALVAKWNEFQKQRLRSSSHQRYDRNMIHLMSLNTKYVDDIDISAVDALVTRWKCADYAKPKFRKNFDHELELLQTLLTYYRRRFNGGFAMPLLQEHFEAATLKIKGSDEVAVLEVDEFLKFVESLQRQRNQMYAPLAKSQFGLALRIGEGCGLMWSDFDFDKQQVVISRTVSWNRKTWEWSINAVKNGKERTLHIPDFVLEALMELKASESYQMAESGLIFHQNGEPIQSKVVAAAYDRARKECGFVHVSGTHFIRKSGATLANDMTGDIRAVQELLDHSSPVITQRYTKKKLSRRKKASDAINRAFYEAQAGKVPMPDSARENRSEIRSGSSRGSVVNSLGRGNISSIESPNRPQTSAEGSTSLTGAVRTFVKLVLPQTTSTKGSPECPITTLSLV